MSEGRKNIPPESIKCEFVWPFKLLIVLLILITLSSCSGGSEIKKAKELIELGMHTEANSLLEAHILDNPKNALAHLTLGKSYFITSRHKDALASFSRSVSIDNQFGPEIAAIYIQHGTGILTEGRYKIAHDFLSRAVHFDSATTGEVARKYMLSSVDLLESGNYTSASEIAALGVQLNPESSKILTEPLRISISDSGSASLRDLEQRIDILLDYDKDSGTFSSQELLKQIENQSPRMKTEEFSRLILKANELSSESRPSIVRLIADRMESAVNNFGSTTKNDFVTLSDISDEFQVFNEADPIKVQYMKSAADLARGLTRKSVDGFNEIANTNDDSHWVEKANEIVQPASLGIKKFPDSKEIRFDGYYRMLQIRLDEVEVREKEVELKFEATGKGGDSSGLMWAEKIHDVRFGPSFDIPHIIDDLDARLNNISGLKGVDEQQFNNSLMTFQLPQSGKVFFSVIFPRPQEQASSFTYKHPGYSGRHGEWSWHIPLKPQLFRE